MKKKVINKIAKTIGVVGLDILMAMFIGTIVTNVLFSICIGDGVNIATAMELSSTIAVIYRLIVATGVVSAAVEIRETVYWIQEIMEEFEEGIII